MRDTMLIYVVVGRIETVSYKNAQNLL